MLYGEFLTGINRNESKYNYKEYERINAIYNNDNEMSKEDAYKLYKEPDPFTQELMTENEFWKSKNLEKEIQIYNLEKEAEKLKNEIKSLESVRQSLQTSLQECWKESEIATKRISNIIWG